MDWLVKIVLLGTAKAVLMDKDFGVMLDIYKSKESQQAILPDNENYSGWSSWNNWSQCTKRCGTGRQSRYRTCKTNIDEAFQLYLVGDLSFEDYLKLTPTCEGSPVDHRPCNRHVCGASWTPWQSWSACSKTCGFNGEQIRRRDCAMESSSSKTAFLTSNVPLNVYLKSFAQCEGIRTEIRKCSVSVCPIAFFDKSEYKQKQKAIENGKEISKWTDWVSQIVLFQKVTEKVEYMITAKTTAYFLNIRWSNHLQNPTTELFNTTAKMLETAIDKSMLTFAGFRKSHVIQFAKDEKSGSDDDELGTYVRLILNFDTMDTRGNGEKIKEEFQGRLAILESRWREWDLLDVLPGTLGFQVSARSEDADECEEKSCYNEGICVDLAGDIACRCRMEHYGKRCQHTRYHTPPALEIPFVSVSPKEVTLKWVPPPEDPSIGAEVEYILMSADNGVESKIPKNITDLTLNVNPEQEYKLRFQIIYKNGLRSFIREVPFRAAPELEKPFVVSKTHDAIRLQWTPKENIQQYQIYTLNKFEEGEDRLQEVLWHGDENEAYLNGLLSDHNYRLALLGVVEGGATNTIEFDARTLLAPPEVDWDSSKVGWTSAVIEWAKVPRANGYNIVVYQGLASVEENELYRVELPPSENSVDIQGLDYESTYTLDISAISKNVNYTSKISSNSFTTEAELHVLNKVVPVHVRNIKTTEAELSWVLPDYNITKQTLYLGTDGKFDLDIEANNFIMDSFSPFQSYVVSVEIVDENGLYSDRGEGTTFTTAPDFGHVIATATDASIIYRWKAVENARKYYFRVNKTEEFQPIRSEQLVFRREQLEPNTEYLFEIYAEIDDDVRTDSVESNVKTAPALGQFTIELDEEDRAGSAIMLWTTDLTFDAISISSEPPIAQLEGSEEFLISSSKSSFKISGMKPATHYKFFFQGVRYDDESEVRSPVKTSELITALSKPVFIESLDSNKVTDEMIRVNWRGVARANEYEVKIDDDEDRKKFISATFERSAMWKGLPPDVEHRILLRAISSQAPPSEWAEMTVTTRLSSPEMSVNYVAPDKVGLIISNVKSGDELFAQVATDWEDLNSIKTYPMFEADSPIVEMMLDDLNAGTDYVARIRVRSGETGLLSFPEWTDVKVSTEPDVPQFSCVPLSESISCKWASKSDRVKTVEVRWNQGGEPQLFTTSKNPFEIQNLTPYVNTKLQIKSFAGENVEYSATEWSDEIVVRTEPMRLVGQALLDNHVEDLDSESSKIEEFLRKSLAKELKKDEILDISLINVLNDPENPEKKSFVIFEVDLGTVVNDKLMARFSLMYPHKSPEGLQVIPGSRGTNSVGIEWDRAQNAVQYEYLCKCESMQDSQRTDRVRKPSAEIVDLLPADVCTVQIRSKIDDIWSLWSEPVMFSTLPYPPMVRKVPSQTSSLLIEVLNPYKRTKGYEINYYWFNSYGKKELPKNPIYAGEIMPEFADQEKRGEIIVQQDRHVIKMPKMRSGTKYYVTVKSLIDQDGRMDVSEESQIVALQTGPDAVKPSCESGLTTDKELVISWLDVKGAAQYRVELRSFGINGDLGPILKEKTIIAEDQLVRGSHSFRISPPGGMSGIEYQISVFAISDSREVSDSHSVVCELKPSPPEFLQIQTFKPGVIKIAWPESYGIVSYDVNVKNSDDELVYEENEFPLESVLIHDLAPGEEFFVEVYSVSASMRSSPAKKAFKIVPEAPLVKVIPSEDEEIEIYFSKVIGAENYIIAMFDNNMEPVSGIAEFGTLPADHPGKITFHKHLLTPGIVYKLAVGAVNSGGTSSPKLVDVILPPPKVVLENIKAIEGSLEIFWERSEGARRYEVKVFLVKSEETLKQTFITSEPSLKTQLSSKLAYRFEIRGVNEGGKSQATVGTFGMDIPVWMQWGAWGECRSDDGKKCGFGSRIRLRQCSVFSTSEYGITEQLLTDECEGDSADKEPCNAGVDDCTELESVTKYKKVTSSSSEELTDKLTDMKLCENFAACCLKNQPSGLDSWMSVDLEGRKEVSAVRIMLGEDLRSFEVRVGETPGTGNLCIAQQETLSAMQIPQVMLCTKPLQGRFLSIRKLGYETMTICEIEGWGRPVNVFWSDWAAWSPCSRTCGAGMRQRTKECIGGEIGDEGCRGLPIEDEECSDGPCEGEINLASGLSTVDFSGESTSLLTDGFATRKG